MFIRGYLWGSGYWEYDSKEQVKGQVKSCERKRVSDNVIVAVRVKIRDMARFRVRIMVRVSFR